MTQPRKQVCSVEIQPALMLETKSSAYSLVQTNRKQTLRSLLKKRSHSLQLALYSVASCLLPERQGYLGTSLQQAGHSLETHHQCLLARVYSAARMPAQLYLSSQLLLHHQKMMMMKMEMSRMKEKNLRQSTRATLQKLTSRAQEPSISSQVPTLSYLK